jgi:bifunctional UDP-N-acetylglucosamine pyrophosphorylase/glucosamine-1-phosphate N-acetyltransferase
MDQNLRELLEKNGVRFESFDGVAISPDVKIAKGTVIYQGTIIRGDSKIGEDTVLGPNTIIDNSIIGNNCVINSSQVYSSVIHSGVAIGPFAHIRPGCVIKDGVKIGNFVEVKNSVLGENTKASHLTYIGDSDVGRDVNFGCGSVTVNYDGVKKARCKIGDRAFIGCNTNLIAPISIGDDAYTAAGSTLTKDVPAGALAISREREQKIIEGWTARRKNKQK